MVFKSRVTAFWFSDLFRRYAGTVLKPVQRAVPVAGSKTQHGFMAQKILQYLC